MNGYRLTNDQYLDLCQILIKINNHMDDKHPDACGWESYMKSKMERAISILDGTPELTFSTKLFKEIYKSLEEAQFLLDEYNTKTGKEFKKAFLILDHAEELK